jgi:hypothetical protein
LAYRLLQLLVLAATGSHHPTSLEQQQQQQQQIFTPPGVLAGAGCCWSDSHAVLMRAIVDSCPKVVTDNLSDVITALRAAAQQPALTKSAAFGQLLMALVKGYAAVLTPQQVEQLLAAAAATTSFMTKSVVAKLQQLQLAAEHAAADAMQH